MGHRSQNVQELITALQSTLAPESLSIGSQKNLRYATDKWPRLQIWDRMAERVHNIPDAVAYPKSENELIHVLKLCQTHRIPAIPYGQGNGACGGTVPSKGGIIIDTKRLQSIGRVDDIDLTIDVEAGVTGAQLEAALNKQGYTLGHFPLTTLSSTVGGWLAARSAGQYSSRYGTAADMVESLTVVLSNGETLDTNDPQQLEWNQLILGSEGTLGVITKARLRVHPLAEAETYRGYRFRTLEAGLLGIRLLMQSGLRPHLVHLYDPFESLLQSSGEGASRGGLASGVLTPLKDILSPDAGSARARAGKKFGLAIALARPAMLNSAVDKLPVPCLLVFGFQGTQPSVDQDMTTARQLLEQAGGTDGGEGPGHRWKSRPHGVPLRRTGVFAAGAFTDTMDVSCIWSRVHDVYTAVRRAVAPYALVLTHFTHAYREGCAVSFTFVCYRRDPASLDRLYEKMWDEALEAAAKAGASISHHRGIGLAKKEHMRREHGAGIRLMFALKTGLDRDQLLNPGKLLPDRAILE